MVLFKKFSKYQLYPEAKDTPDDATIFIVTWLLSDYCEVNSKYSMSVVEMIKLNYYIYLLVILLIISFTVSICISFDTYEYYFISLLLISYLARKLSLDKVDYVQNIRIINNIVEY